MGLTQTIDPFHGIRKCNHFRLEDDISNYVNCIRIMSLSHVCWLCVNPPPLRKP